MKVGITSVQGDLLSSGCQTLVCTVNTVGVMGKGIALDFKNRIPGLFAHYKRLCDRGLLNPGDIFLYRVPGTLNKQILGVATKRQWRYNSQEVWIEKILVSINKDWEHLNIQSLAMPMLGCGNGGLEWKVIRELVINHLRELPIPVELFEPEHYSIKQRH